MTPTSASLASVEWHGLAFLSKGASSLVEILTQIELQRLRLHVDLASELLQVPAPGADGSTHAQWRILVDFVSQRTRDVEIGAPRRHSVDEPRFQRFLGSEEPSGQCHLCADGGAAAKLH